jgi:ferredoxin
MQGWTVTTGMNMPLFPRPAMQGVMPFRLGGFKNLPGRIYEDSLLVSVVIFEAAGHSDPNDCDWPGHHCPWRQNKPGAAGERGDRVQHRYVYQADSPQLGVTGKALARELKLPLKVSKGKPLTELGITDEQLSHVVEHLRSHVDATGKYYVFFAIVMFGFLYLIMLGRPDSSDIKERNKWYPRFPYIAALLFSVVIAGFCLGKSPNPMEGFVKVLKSLVGLYPDPMVKLTALFFFLGLAVVGNKLICGWACPFGALQELIYNIPGLGRLKRRKLPFVFSNIIRVILFVVMLLFLFGLIGAGKGLIIYHYINPFNLFSLDFECIGVVITVIVALIGSLFVYRPFCHIICPFGLISWLFERFSITRVKIDYDKCIQCGACSRECPSDAAKDRVDLKTWQADCFSCARCLKVCAKDAIRYESVFNRRQPNIRDRAEKTYCGTIKD